MKILTNTAFLLTTALLLLLAAPGARAADFGPADGAKVADGLETRPGWRRPGRAVPADAPGGGAALLLGFFRNFISVQDGPACRYHPSCGGYAREAVQKTRALLGSFLAGDRLLRCNPYNQPGVDPVPEAIDDTHDGTAGH